MWTRKEYEEAAEKIARQFVDSAGQCSINKIATDMARDNGLPPEGIRTMVRLANVSAFQGLFEKRSGDKMIEFELGDPEIVITNLHTDAKQTFLEGGEKTAYDRASDYFSPLDTLVTKIAEAPVVKHEPEIVRLSKAEAIYLLKEAEDRFRLAYLQQQQCWLDNMEKAAQQLLLCGRGNQDDRTLLEKEALSTCGDSVAPELHMLQYLTGGTIETPLCGGEKYASVIEHHLSNPTKAQKVALGFLKTASIARMKLAEHRSSREFVERHLNKLRKV